MYPRFRHAPNPNFTKVIWQLVFMFLFLIINMCMVSLELVKTSVPIFPCQFVIKYKIHGIGQNLLGVSNQGVWNSSHSLLLSAFREWNVAMENLPCCFSRFFPLKSSFIVEDMSGLRWFFGHRSGKIFSHCCYQSKRVLLIRIYCQPQKQDLPFGRLSQLFNIAHL